MRQYLLERAIIKLMNIDALLQETLLEVVEKQIVSGEPPVTRATFERLKRAGYSEADAKQMIARVLVIEEHTVISEGQPFDLHRLERTLSQIPPPPPDHWD